MEKVDGVILSTLKDVGCDLEEGAKSIEDLSSKTILLALSRCLNLINPSLEYPTAAIPRQMSAAVSLCTKMCSSIKELGYRDALGYHQLLYSSPVENRRLLSWIITQLPSTESEDASAQSLGTSLAAEVAGRAQAERKGLWTLNFIQNRDVTSFPVHVTHVDSVRLDLPTSGSAHRSRHKVIEAFLREYSSLLTVQPPRESQLVSAVLETNAAKKALSADKEAEWNTVGLDSGLNPFDYARQKQERVRAEMGNVLRTRGSMAPGERRARAVRVLEPVRRRGGRRGKASRFRHQMEFSKDAERKKVDQEELEKEKEAARQQEIAEVEAKLARLALQLETGRKRIADMKTNQTQLGPAISKETERTEELKEKLVNLRRTNELLENAEENIAKLEQIAAKNTENLLKLATQWEEVRFPLLLKLREQKDSLTGRKGAARQKMATVKEMRREMAELKETIDEQDEQLGKVTEVMQKVQTDLTRELFTDTIDEIVKQVKKQQVQIDRILQDTRVLKKTRNTTSDTLSRSFALASDMVYKDAKSTKKGERTARQMFKVLADLHRRFSTLSDTVEEAGNCSNERLRTDQRVRAMEPRMKAVNLEDLLTDLEQMRAENRTLQGKDAPPPVKVHHVLSPTKPPPATTTAASRAAVSPADDTPSKPAATLTADKPAPAANKPTPAANKPTSAADTPTPSAPAPAAKVEPPTNGLAEKKTIRVEKATAAPVVKEEPVAAKGKQVSTP
eukprot:CAMPEP_0119126398 /NCGR_PEP_ID=MMETSP1310-20130426/5340_1 /TAXON_ID=464262 /ORGANISM="Genus nov. species nov., Strain RCC2339" /LENGTH=734 /DNA_ID=CAMNT_0007116557 /DNA_START=122 /DNA_END=2322 /DNA_ORIENTATION=-